MPNNHIMLDLETWGTNINAPIISIGAVRFDPFQVQEITDLDKIHIGIDLTDTLLGQPDAATLMWWMDPSRREALDQWLALPKIDIHGALYEYTRWAGDDFKQWGNGSTFDNVILSQAYVNARLPRPWTYRDELDMRTVTLLAGDKIVWPERTGEHNALEDAKYQVRVLQLMIQELIK